MESAEVLEELNQPGAQELLGSVTLARLAYTGLDGFPRVIPIGFYWNGEAIVVCTAPISPKVRSLNEDGHVAVSIDTDAAKALSIRGVAALETVDGVPNEYFEVAKKAMGGTQLDDFETQARAVHKQMVQIAIRPLWACYYDFGAGRLPAFLTELVEDAQHS